MAFGIIDHFDTTKDYSEYVPQQYDCIELDDDLYMNNWCDAATNMPTYFNKGNLPAYNFARWGVTLIQPSSLPIFLHIFQTDRYYQIHNDLKDLSLMIQKAMKENKFMIHFGV